MAALNFIIILSLFWFAAVKAGVEQDALNAHNRLRDLHGAPHLKLSAKLSSEAKAYAVQLAKLGKLKHSNHNNKYSENLCFRSSNPEKCTQFWYDEIKDYNFSNPNYSMKSGHFTALVWASSSELGYGQARAKNGYYYVVARYAPIGNIFGRFGEEVHRLLRH